MRNDILSKLLPTIILWLSIKIVSSFHTIATPSRKVQRHPSSARYSSNDRFDKTRKHGIGNSNSEDNESDEKSARKQPPIPEPFSMIEGAVKSVTGDENYKFGDYSKRAFADTKQALTDTGKLVTGNDDYEFGDITKGLLNEAGRAVTGDENYQFGDITRSMMKDMEKSLEIWNGRAFEELPVLLWKEAFSNMDSLQKKASIVALVRLLAIALLSWGFVSNICTVASATFAWTRSCCCSNIVTTLPSPHSIATTSVRFTKQAALVPSMTAAISLNPFQIGQSQRQVFLNTYVMTRLSLDPFFLIIQGAGTLLILMKYQKFVFHIEQNWISSRQRTKFPLLHRITALALAFACNMGFALVMTGCGLCFGSAIGYLKLKLL